MTSSLHPTPRDRRFVEWTLRHGRLLWAVALLLAVPAIWRTVHLYTHLRGEIEELLPRGAPSVRALDELRSRSPGMMFLGVVAKVEKPGDLGAAEKFVDDLAARVRTYPPSLVREVRANNDQEKSFLEKHAALYVQLGDLKEIRRRIEARRDYEVSKAAGSLMDEDEPPPSTDFSDIEAKYKSELAGQKDGHFTSPELKSVLLIVEAGGFTTGADAARVLLDRVQRDVVALDPAKYAAGMRVGYASDVAINVEELEALQEDLSVSSVVVIVAVIAVIVFYYQWWKAVMLLLAPLLLATTYTFGLASLPPIGITELNANTGFLGSIIIGNGINFGIILLARYREERRRGATVEEGLITGVWGARSGTIAAAAAAGAAYASLIVTDFRGFRQFGYIGGLGMLTSWVAAFVLTPPLVRWVDREKDVPAGVAGHHRVMGGLARMVLAGAPAVVAAAALLAGISVQQVARFDRSSSLEYDFNKLRRADTWKNGAGYWSNTMDALLGHYLTPTVVLADSREQARAVEDRVREAVDHGPLHGLVARVIGAEDVLPGEQDAKLREVRAIRSALTPKLRSYLPEDKRKLLDTLLGEDALRPIGVADLPSGLVAGLRERDGTFGRMFLVYPAATDALWKADGIRQFVATLRDLAATAPGSGGRPARVAGQIPLSDDILTLIARDAPIASGVSFFGVVAIVLLVVRRRRSVVAVLGALLLGVLWLCGTTMALGIKINFTNFIAFPITLGIGVDYAVNVMTRYRQDGERDVTGAIAATGGAVALCSITTIIGYSSLLLAKNRALFLFGLVAVLGEFACLAAAVIALPAWLVLAQRWKQRRSLPA